MKLSSYIADIERAYQSIMHDIAVSTGRVEYAFNYRPRRPAHILPRSPAHSRPPQLAPDYNPDATAIPFSSKEKLVLLSAFQATYHDQPTPLTPDMVPVIIDTGASISLSPYDTDFIGKIHPVQDVTLKGIASGLRVAGSSIPLHQ
jgi:hypothetical protein